MRGAEQAAGQRSGEHAGPWAPGVVGDGVGRHGAEDEDTLVAEIDPAGALGQALAQAHEEEGRADAHGPGEDGDQDCPGAEIAAHRPISRGWNQRRRP